MVKNTSMMATFIKRYLCAPFPGSPNTFLYLHMSNIIYIIYIMFSKYHLIFLFSFLAIVINSIIYANGSLYSKTNKSKYIPPGYMVGTIWVLLFGILGYILHRLHNYTSSASISIYIFILFSLLYPFITKLSQSYLSVICNKIALLLAYAVCYFVYIEKRWLAIYLLPLFSWITYVNVAV
jgi:tryptophan-rich sensory protein